MKVALIHYWLTSRRGGEKVLEGLCEMFPHADVFSLVVDHESLSGRLRRHRIIPSFVQRIPGSRRFYQGLLPLYPLALEQFDLRGYDLVISSESGPAKGVLTRPETCHLCYCHTPMRYLWDLYHDYRNNAGLLTRLLMPLLAHRLRQWDVLSAQRVDHFAANSRNVARRIRKYYRRESRVIYPPVDTERFGIEGERGDFYLMVGQLVSYKRPDLAVAAFTRMGKPLVVIGEGAELSGLKKLGGPTIRFLGRQSDEVVRSHYARCRAFVFPGEEDFGITPVEAQASGRPVIAYGRGGALETVEEGVTGLFFDRPEIDALVAAVARFEAMESRFAPEAIRRRSLVFGRERFMEEMARFTEEKLASHRREFGSGRTS